MNNVIDTTNQIATDKNKVLDLQALSEVDGGLMSWSTTSGGCGSVRADEWSTTSDGCR